ncbi:MAG: hypothetical protein NC929_01555, partial [Candidatus Omnitrophica bacterium]|nr:hypothetical protein [Candidatus Omnitrophota bacterium]
MDDLLKELKKIDQKIDTEDYLLMGKEYISLKIKRENFKIIPEINDKYVITFIDGVQALIFDSSFFFLGARGEAGGEGGGAPGSVGDPEGLQILGVVIKAVLLDPHLAVQIDQRAEDQPVGVEDDLVGLLDGVRPPAVQAGHRVLAHAGPPIATRYPGDQEGHSVRGR